MERCKICGEFIDWNNPNIHYSGGHKCDTDILNSFINGPARFNPLPPSVISWREVFNGYMMFPKTYSEVLEFVRNNTMYRYISYNGQVYYITDFKMAMPLCKIEDLK